jgi:uncharacterized protein YndB with AHSA1/START domain
MGEYEGQSFEDKGIVKEFSPIKRLLFDYYSAWSRLEDKPENYKEVGYELKAKGEQTVLRLSQKGFASEENMRHAEAGWNAVLQGLKTMLETSYS